ncbi:MAG: acyl-CoA dehydrogenase family protein [Pseudomonadales bacterium]|jgi:alkylation response protein AidB-like acyl-CoA dehydrogenase|nr:acyl-CoA dehydrogenase [Gammaproteobacteria bacterium]MDP6025969.1 acyl-CoA dehydrogenase family protein [Pseudomonadales bacterium]MDP6316832.1 acyl-CoA dehydrogenase family protein [Pseudomonadales bacterium]MDP7314554.1 acyl-CoA dehydrogenase family protein [Pseudomonadales bacterium]MDP7575380.1 acyl-CoA dehydrogenase family protein [Pseudomonadales bacterium]|tara:strand:+ start:5781 stop:6917 length:1137 start_codon:yes stop_codon:yes gene_type:complete
MAQSKNFGFGEDEMMLRDSAQKFFSDNCTADKIHSQVAPDSDIYRDIDCIWDESLWHQICELGWTAACVPESAGGIGMSVVAAVALAEEAGKAAFPSPLLSTFNSTFVLTECQTDNATKALGDIASGKAMTLAITNSKGSWESTDTDVSVTDNKLSGTAYYVQDAQKADSLIVAAKNGDGSGLYLVDSTDKNVTIHADGIIDLTRDQAHIDFNDVDAMELAAPGTGNTALKNAMPAILCITAADMVGSGEWLLQTTVEYATTRVQFDRPLGFFQAVKHPLVNVMLQVDQAKSLAYSAACAIDEEPDNAEKLARMAKSAASDMAVYSSSRSVQFHGGIGFTWECYVHLFFKRQMHNHILYGDGKYQRTKLADMLIGEVA